jgi:hypothetical protein
MWAHGGFDVDIEILQQLMQQYPQLYIDLSLRDGMTDEAGQLTQAWRTLLIASSQRFLVGMDTYKPARWAELPETSSDTRNWLNQLPQDVAANIAHRNIDSLFPE